MAGVHDKIFNFRIDFWLVCLLG